ncbi:hypothetical protein WA588_005206 [Blastocystis sp. NMH]
MQTTDDIYYFDTDGTTMQLLETEPNSVDPTNVHGEKESGSLLRRGWKSLKKGVKTTGDKIKESGVAQRTAETFQKVRDSDFGQRVAATSRLTVVVVKDGVRKGGRAIRTGYEKVKHDT